MKAFHRGLKNEFENIFFINTKNEDENNLRI